LQSLGQQHAQLTRWLVSQIVRTAD